MVFEDFFEKICARQKHRAQGLHYLFGALGYGIVTVAEMLTPEPGVHAVDKDIKLMESTCEETFEASFCCMVVG